MFQLSSLSIVSTQPLQQQTFGMGFAPKRILNVMEGEIARAFQLSKNIITPLPYVVPRKVLSILEFKMN